MGVCCCVVGTHAHRAGSSTRSQKLGRRRRWTAAGTDCVQLASQDGGRRLSHVEPVVVCMYAACSDGVTAGSQSEREDQGDECGSLACWAPTHTGGEGQGHPGSSTIPHIEVAARHRYEPHGRRWQCRAARYRALPCWWTRWRRREGALQSCPGLPSRVP